MKGIWFDNKHSFDDFNLILSATEISPPEPKTTYVEVAGADGSLDLSEALGEIRFKDREAKFTFTVFPYDDFEEKKRQINNFLHGRKMNIRLDKNPTHYWVGRCHVDEYASDRNVYQIVIGATLQPYQLKNTVTAVTVAATSTAEAHILTNGRRSVVPVINCTGAVEIGYNGLVYALNAGQQKVLGIKLLEGDNTVTVKGSGSVTFTYQEGDL